MNIEKIYSYLIANIKKESNPADEKFFEKELSITSDFIKFKNISISKEQLAFDSHSFSSEELTTLEYLLDSLLTKSEATLKVVNSKVSFMNKELEFTNKVLTSEFPFNSIIDGVLENIFTTQSQNDKYFGYNFENIYSVVESGSFFSIESDSFFTPIPKIYSNDNSLRLWFGTKYTVDNLIFSPVELNNDLFDVFVEVSDSFEKIYENVNLSLINNLSIQKSCYSILIKGVGISNLSTNTPRINCKNLLNSEANYTGFFKLKFDYKKDLKHLFKIMIPTDITLFLVKNDFDYKDVPKDSLYDCLVANSDNCLKLTDSSVYDYSLYDYHIVGYINSKIPTTKKPLLFIASN